MIGWPLSLPAALRLGALCLGLVALSAALVRWMLRHGTLDIPGARSSHDRPIPKGGGVGIVVAWVAGTLLLGGLAGALPAFVLAAVGLAVVSHLDDHRSFSFAIKLAAQAAGGALVIAAGLRLDPGLLPGLPDAAALGGIISLAWLLFVTNAVNFIDGIDGLAAGAAGLSALAVAALALRAHLPLVAAASLPLAAGVAGFLPFNFPRARIFMGDVGSQLCGFVLAALGLALAASTTDPMRAALVPMLLFGVLFDVAFTLVRRLAERQRLTEAHRGHLYQVAVRAGLPAARVTLIYWAMTGWGAACWTLACAMPKPCNLLAMLMILPPQLAWWRFVRGRARRIGLTRW